MGRCDYCETDITNTYHDYLDSAMHRSCKDERNRRVDDKLCVFCGKDLGQEEFDLNDIKHERCRILGKYFGYPYQ